MLKAIMYGAVLAVVSACASVAPMSSVQLSAADLQKPVGGIEYALPIGRVTLTIEAGENKDGVVQAVRAVMGEDAISLDPDPNARFVANFNESNTSDDHVCIARTADGMLSALQVTTEDRRDDIAFRVIETALSVSTLGSMDAGVFGDGAGTGLGAVEKWVAFASVTFDPHSAAEVSSATAAVKSALSNNYPTAKRSREITRALAADGATIINFGISPVARSLTPPAKDTDKLSSNGIFYRSVRAYQFTISSTVGVTQIASIELPDPSSAAFIEVRRTPLVRSDTKVALSSGILTSYENASPSSALAAATFPGEVIGYVLELPSRILTPLIRATQTETDYIEAKAQKTLAEAQAAAIVAGESETLTAQPGTLVQGDFGPVTLSAHPGLTTTLSCTSS